MIRRIQPISLPLLTIFKKLTFSFSFSLLNHFEKCVWSVDLFHHKAKLTFASTTTMSDNDELVSQFLAFTGSADTDRAASYLEMSNGDLERAVGLYLEHQGGGGGGGPSGGAGSFGAATGGEFGMGGDDVRAPDATRTMRLMDDLGPSGMMMGGGHHPYMALDPMIQQQLSTSAFARDVVNISAAAAEAADESMDGKTDEDGDEDGGDKKNNGVAGLADMFSPPRHLMFKEGGFEGARTMAKDSKRWLLVNLQRDSEFSCHALNRDVWRDELVENLIREGFIFWQEVRCDWWRNYYRGRLFRKSDASSYSYPTRDHSSPQNRWTPLQKGPYTLNDTKFMISLTSALLTHVHAVCCGGKKVGHNRSH
jgi:hypothetical protein